MKRVRVRIKDSGRDYYTYEASDTVLGRMYDNKADVVEVAVPQAERGSRCTMIVTAGAEVVDHIDVGESGVVEITSRVSQWRKVRIGFSFSRADGYVKNSEVKEFEFLEAQRPDGFVAEKAVQSGNIDALILHGFTWVDWKEGSHNTLQFRNVLGQVTRELDLHGFTQEQADLGEKDEESLSFVQGKRTSNLENDGDEDSPFVTEKRLGEYTPDFSDYYTKEEVDSKIDEIPSGVSAEELEAVERDARKVLVLGANGTIGINANFEVEDAESYLPYRQNLTEFIFSGIIPVTGEVDLSKEVTITFGDTSYYVFSAVDTSKRLTLGDLDFALRESLVTGYNYLFRTVFFNNSDKVGFAVLPDKEDVLSLNSDQMDDYMADGGLPNGQLAICSKVITNGYVEGAIYRFKITYPSTYEWEELVANRTFGDLTLNQTGTMLVSNQTFTGHVHTMVEFETDGMHYGADFVLHPYDSSICLVSFSFGTYSSTAYLGEDGKINIAIPSGLTVTNVKAHFIRLGD